jgi:hypothetical protein
MSRSSRGESANARNVRQRLRNKHGLNTGRNSALPEDEGLDRRARRGLAKENSKAFGISGAESAIHGRVNGDLLGRKNT